MRKKARKKSQTRGEKCNRRTTYVGKVIGYNKKEKKKKNELPLLYIQF